MKTFQLYEKCDRCGREAGRHLTIVPGGEQLVEDFGDMQDLAVFVVTGHKKTRSIVRKEELPEHCCHDCRQELVEALAVAAMTWKGGDDDGAGG